MRKKIVLLYVRRHAGEIDWILPLLFKYKNKYKIISIFSNQSCYQSLKNNKDLFKIWKSLSRYYYIINFKDKILWKVINKILQTQFFNLFKKNFFFLTFHSYILKNTFDLCTFLKIFKIKLLDIKILFQPTVDKSYISKLFKINNPKILIVRFPEATMITANKKENPHLKTSQHISTNGDIFLFTTKNDKDFFLGDNKKLNKKILYAGFLRYEKWWIKKFYNKDRNKNMFKILVALRGPNELYFQEASYNETIYAIMESIKKINKCKVIFKVHPQEKNNLNLLNILNKYNKKTWAISTDHMIKLSNNANFCISILSSACFDSLLTKTPTIEYYDVDKEIFLSNKAINSYHMVYVKNKKKWLTIFKYKNLVKTIDNKKDLEKIILHLYNKKKNSTWGKNFKKFDKLIKNRNSVDYVFNKINSALLH